MNSELYYIYNVQTREKRRQHNSKKCSFQFRELHWNNEVTTAITEVSCDRVGLTANTLLLLLQESNQNPEKYKGFSLNCR